MHDRNGTELRVGDRVIIEAVISSVSSGEEFCNVTLKSVAGRRPDFASETFCCNTGVVALVERPVPIAGETKAGDAETQPAASETKG